MIHILLLYIHWDINPEIANVFGISFRYYSILFLSGLLLSYYKLSNVFKREHFQKDLLDSLLIYGIVGIMVGARLGHCLFYQPEYFLSHPLEMVLPFRFYDGFEFTGYQGLASHGGVFGIFIAIIIFAKKKKLSFIKIIDMTAIVSGIGAGFIRLANLMNSEIIGKPTKFSWGFIFERVDHVPRHPAQLYEAICYFLIFILLNQLYMRNKGALGTGFFFGILITSIFSIRFFIEFIKENQVSFEDDLLVNMGQILSVPYVLLGLGFILYGLRKYRSLQ